MTEAWQITDTVDEAGGGKLMSRCCLGSVVLLWFAALSLMAGCATRSELKEVESNSNALVSQVEQDRALAERDLAIASLRYQNANDSEKAAIKENVARLQAKVNDLDKIASEAREARRGVAALQDRDERERQAIQEALDKFDRAQQAYKEYQRQVRY